MSEERVHIPGWLLGVLGGLILTVCSATGGAIYWAGQISTRQEAQGEQIRQLQEQVERLQRQRDWERRRESAK